MPFPTTFHHHFQHPSVPPDAGKWGSGVPALTMEQIEELFPDWQLQFQQHAEDAGYPSEHWPDKSLWSPLVPRYVAGYDEMWIPTTLAFDKHGEAPEAGLLGKASQTVRQRYDTQLPIFTNSGTAAFLPMQGPKVEGWWEHGSILIKDPATLFLACVASASLSYPAGEARNEALSSLQTKRRGRPPAANNGGLGAEEAEKRARYEQWLEACKLVRMRKDALKVEIEELRASIKQKQKEMEEMRAPERPE
jgi:hypothetical protein